MKRLYSIETKQEIDLGQVVEYLPYRTGTHMCWVKIKDLDAARGQVHVASADGSINAWTAAENIGAQFGRVPRPHGQTKKQAQDEANKAADARENSLAGGRCSSTGLSGDARRMMEDLAARGLTPTGRRPSQPEMQDFPARDMHGARAGAPAEQFQVEGVLETVTCYPKHHILLATGPELDAIMAGLRLLAREVKAGNVKFSDSDDIGYIWTNSGDHDGLPPAALHDLATRLNGG